MGSTPVCREDLQLRNQKPCSSGSVLVLSSCVTLNIRFSETVFLKGQHLLQPSLMWECLRPGLGRKSKCLASCQQLWHNPARS